MTYNKMNWCNLSTNLYVVKSFEKITIIQASVTWFNKFKFIENNRHTGILTKKLFKYLMKYLCWSQFSLERCDLHSQWTGACLSSQSVGVQSLRPPSRGTYFCLVNLQKEVILFIYFFERAVIENEVKDRICALQTWHGHITVIQCF